MTFWQRIIVNALLFVTLSYFFSGSFFVGSVWIALAASVVFALLNTVVKPVLYVLSLPITILTLGLFSLVINAGMLSMTSWIVGPGFQFSSFGATVLMAILISLANTLIVREGNRG